MNYFNITIKNKLKNNFYFLIVVFTFSLFLFNCHSAQAAFTYINYCRANNGNSGTTLDCSSTLNVAAGDLLVAFGAWESVDTTITVAETGGENSMTMLTKSSQGGAYEQLGYKISATANSSATFRMTNASSAGYRYLFVLQFRPDSGETVTFDSGPGTAGGSGTAIATANINTAGTDEVVFAGTKQYITSTTYSNHQIGGVAADGSFVPASSIEATAWYKIFSSTQSNINATVTAAGSASWTAGVMAFKSSGGTEFTAIVDPGGTGDYSSLNAWNTGVATDLTVATTQVFSGTLDNSVSDNATVYLCDSGDSYRGESATVVHATSSQILVDGITSAVTEVSTDYWNSSSSCGSGTKYFTLSDSGNTAIAVAKCRTTNGAADTTAVTIDGWTTSDTNYIKAWTDPSEPYRHQGKWDESKYRLETNNTAYEHPSINVKENYVQIIGLQIRAIVSTGDNTGTILGRMSDAGNSEITIAQNILRGPGNAGGNSYVDGYQVYATTPTSISKVYNNVIYDFYNTTSGGGITNWDGSSTLYAYNNTIKNCAYGIFRYGGTVIAKNNILSDNTDSFYGTFDSSSTYNINNQSAQEGAFGASADSGTTDGASANKLIDSDQNFLTTVKVGMIVKDSGTNYSYVTAVDNDGQLSLNDDIMGNPETYTIYTNMYGNVSFVDYNKDDFHLKDSDTVAKDKGANLYADSNLAVTTDIDGSSRPDSSTLFDIGADEASTQIYYSVGQNVSSHETGSGNVDVDSTERTATFTVAQTATNMGVGDVIDYGGSNYECYITEKVSTTVWKCQDATGGAPTDSGGDVVVNSIHHVFSSLNQAITNAGGASYLNSYQLPTNNYQLNIPCYYDTGADQTAVTVDGYTTSNTNFIRIYTPNSTDTEVNQSQRHSGKWDDGKYKLEVANATAFTVSDDNVTVEGLQFRTTSASADNQNVIFVSASMANKIFTINNSILRGHRSATYYQRAYIGGSLGIENIINTLIYDVDTTSSNGIRANADTTNIYNCTVIGGNSGIRRNMGSPVVKNTYAGGSAAGDFSGSMTLTTSASSDTTGTAGLQNILVNTTNFTNITSGQEDYHLPSGSILRDAGTNLSNDSYLAFSDDIDGQERTGNWSIGADEPRETEVNSHQLSVNSITDGLVMYQSFDGQDINGDTAIDRSGNENNGTIDGATAAIGKRGQALNFDGSGDVVNISGSTNFATQNSPFSLSAWVNLSDFNDSSYPDIVQLKSDTDAPWHILISNQSGYEGISVGSNSTWATIKTDNIPTLGDWHHVVVTYNGNGAGTISNFKVYQDNSSQTLSAANSYSWQNQASTIGDSSTSLNPFKGKIDEVRIYNRALSADEIGDLYRLGGMQINASQTDNANSGLVGMWSFDGADMDWASSSAEALDRSGNGNDGDVFGATQTIGKKGQALSFNGSSDYVQTNQYFQGYSQITLSVWAKKIGAGNRDPRGIILGGGSTYIDICYDGHVLFSLDTSDQGQDLIQGGSCSDTGEWTHYVATYNGNIARLYVNGQQVSSDVDRSGTVQSSDTDTFIGAYYYGGADYYFRGIIDEVRIYDQALTADEVGDLYRMGQAIIHK